MEIFKTQISCLFFFLVLLSSSICPGYSLPPAGTSETTTNKKEVPAGVPQSEGNNAPLLASSPNGTRLKNTPFLKPVGSQGQQFQLGHQQQQELNYPQQSINQPLSDFNKPYPTISQPYSGFNRPFGATNQQDSLENAALDNGVSKKSSFQGVVVVSLLNLMLSFGFPV